MVSNLASVRRRLSDNLKKVRERIHQAAERGRRRPEDIRLVAVTKYVEVDVIRQALELGVLDIGESRAQQLNQRAGMMHEYFERKSVLGGRREGPAPRPRWHMVGHLQRNKVKLVVPWAELVHSVDSLRLAEDLHQQAAKLGRVVDILLQVNTSGERSKFGIAVGAAPHLVEHLAEWPSVRLCGLMTMAPLDSKPQELRLAFERLRDVFEDMRGEHHLESHFKELSMGMSNDFETAIECGATMVRIGSLLFEGLSSPAAAPDEDEA
ncbi:MAG TPA: YggS family pyridoxal phosphate-dependent enzyme [Phycisphaerae bacterium]|nr:YggS family pyridoxal phosphate-dependent enzyme [Phycisphaerae bacterium]